MWVLGVHIGHDSSAALVRDGQLVADVAEERFSRIKHDAGLPTRAVAWCLKSAGLELGDLDAVAVASRAPVPQLNFLFSLKGKRIEKASLPGRALNLGRRLLKRKGNAPPLYFQGFQLPERVPLIHIEHHHAHAASGYFTQPDSLSPHLVITMDGCGDDTSIAMWRGERGTLTCLHRWGPEGSLGWFYSNVTEALGWWHGDGEGKTMALAAMDKPLDTKSLKGFFPEFHQGDLVRPCDFGRRYQWPERGAMHWHFHQASALRQIIQKMGREPVAATAQDILEAQTLNLVLPHLKNQGTKNLCCAGGVFLNVKLNQKLMQNDAIHRLHIFPNPGDAGLAAGAALAAAHQLAPDLPCHALNHLFLGPAFSTDDIEQMLIQRKIPFQRLADPSAFAAECIAQGKIVARFQGAMESGPRALGHRSILMRPRPAQNKAIINQYIKFREPFRPFCPSLLETSMHQYMENAKPAPYMITAFNAKPEQRDELAAVIHVDGTLRPQTVSAEIQPNYYSLLEQVGQLTGTPVLLNTSLNVMGEPIACHPRDALRCFFDTGMDLLILNNLAVEKARP